MPDYLALKSLHVACVGVSYALFFVRGLWMLHDPERLRRRWVRIVPHANDTVLLAAGVGLAFATGRYPWVEPWLAAKLAALLAYIGLGLLALGRARSRRARLAAWLAAQLVFFYMVAVALAREPLPGMRRDF